MQCHKGCRLEHPLRAMSLVSWGVERLTRFSLSLYLFRVIWLNIYKVLLCLHCWGITTIRRPSMLAYGLANNNLVCILCSEDGLLNNKIITLLYGVLRGLYSRLIYKLREGLATKRDLFILIANVTLRHKYTFLYSLSHFIRS